MNKSDLEFYFKENMVLGFDNFIISLVVASILSFIVQLFYLKFSSSLSNRLDFSKNFVILGIATTIVITIVKSSLALSLGLVGALSIVRFRAAIKEPEELVYLFFIISIGLSNGANQFLMSIIATFITVTILYLRKIYINKNNVNNITESSTNILQIQSKKDASELIGDLKKNVKYLNLKSFSAEKNLNQYNFWFDIDSEDLTEFMTKIEKITSQDNEIKIQIYSRTGIYE